MKRIKHYPTAIGGLCLGIASIFAFWSAMVVYQPLSYLLLGLGFVIALGLLAPVLFKFLRHPGLLIQDIQHPTVGSIVPATMMTLMLLSRTLGLINEVLAIVIWCVAVLGHILFFSFFLYHRVRDFDLNHLVPTWFVPPIGIVVACLSVPAPWFHPLALVFLCVGIMSYVVLLPVVLYRLSLGDKIEDARKPTLAVLAAPPSLTLAGYLTLVVHPDPLLVLFLFSLAILMTITVYLMLFHLLRLPFTPACTAFTFPLAISAVAMNKLSIWMSAQSLFQGYAICLHVFALAEGVVATVVIAYILQHMLRFILKNVIFTNRVEDVKT